MPGPRRPRFTSAAYAASTSGAPEGAATSRRTKLPVDDGVDQEASGDEVRLAAAKYTTGPIGWMKTATVHAAFGPRIRSAGRLARSRNAAAVITSSSAAAPQMAHFCVVVASDHFFLAIVAAYRSGRAPTQ
jgi:hypothetical protein